MESIDLDIYVYMVAIQCVGFFSLFTQVLLHLNKEWYSVKEEWALCYYDQSLCRMLFDVKNNNHIERYFRTFKVFTCLRCVAYVCVCMWLYVPYHV